MGKKVIVLDTTLRDGVQGNLNFSVEDKIRVARELHKLGIHHIEGGWPGSNPKDSEFFERMKGSGLPLAAFGMTRRPKLKIEDDDLIQSIVKAETDTVVIFGKSWTKHVEIMKGNDLDENISMIQDTIKYFKDLGKYVIYDAEHFFDAFKDDLENCEDDKQKCNYAELTIITAMVAGADAIVLCDTNGATMPHEIVEIIEKVKRFTNRKVLLGIHAHNDRGMAVANTIVAVQNGVSMVHVTINGYGERCGNADAMSVIPNIMEGLKLRCINKDNLRRLVSVSRLVDEIANKTPFGERPFVGENAFAHKGGVHVSAVKHDPKTYEHMNPALVGNLRKIVVSEYCGASNIIEKAKEFGIDLEGKKYLVNKIVKKIKDMENKGYLFEAADASLELLIREMLNDFSPKFILESYEVKTTKDGDKPSNSRAVVVISSGDRRESGVEDGRGPVEALDKALRTALNKLFPELEDLPMHIADYKVRIVKNGVKSGANSKVRVLIETQNENNVWSTVGVSEDIIEASYWAILQSFWWRLLPENC